VLLTISHSALAVIRTNSLSNGAAQKTCPDSDWELSGPPLSPDYFQVMNIPLIKGRTFTKADASSAPPVVIISQSFARRFFPKRGSPWSAHNHFAHPAASERPWPDNCGVVGRRAGPSDWIETPDIEIYAPINRTSCLTIRFPYMSLVVSTVLGPSTLTSGVLAKNSQSSTRTCLSRWAEHQ